MCIEQLVCEYSEETINTPIHDEKINKLWYSHLQHNGGIYMLKEGRQQEYTLMILFM
jgi:hypothetical protein